MSMLRNRYARLLTLVLLLQAGAYYAIAMRSEITPAVAPLSQFPTASKEWHMTRDLPPKYEPIIKNYFEALDKIHGFKK